MKPACAMDDHAEQGDAVALSQGAEVAGGHRDDGDHSDDRQPDVPMPHDRKPA